MKKFFITAVVMLTLGAFSSVYGANGTIHIGGGINSNSAPRDTETSAGVHASADFMLGERPIAIGVFGEGYFKEEAGKPYLFGLNLYYKRGVGEGNATISLGPNVGLASIELAGSRESVLHVGGGVVLNFPIGERIGIFGTGKYAWAAKKDSVKTMSGISVHVGIAFNVGE